MLLQPKNRKYRKAQKCLSNLKKGVSRAHRLSFGSYGLKALEAGLVKASHVEALRRAISRNIKKIGRLWIRIYPYQPISRKPTKTRMGKGKGSVQYWVCPVERGQVLFEIRGSMPMVVAKEILQKASQKLPILTKFITYDSSLGL